MQSLTHALYVACLQNIGIRCSLLLSLADTLIKMLTVSQYYVFQELGTIIVTSGLNKG